ncbi:MAG: hypothetical protein ACR2NZ_12380 [Rubripirellula sp.]
MSSQDSSTPPDSGNEDRRDDGRQVTDEAEGQRGQGNPQDDKPWLKVVGLGMELAGSTLVLAGVGHLVDRYRGKADGVGVAIGAFLGFGLGMFRFIQKALQQIQNP